MIKKLITLVLFTTAVLSAGCVWGGGAVRASVSQSETEKSAESPDPQEDLEKFKINVLPKLHLDGGTARNAIEKLGHLGFLCTLVGEQENILYPSKPLQPFVECMRLLSEKDLVYGLMWVNVHMSNWKGDGTPLALRYEQLSNSNVIDVNAVSIPYGIDLSSPPLKEASRQLDQTLAIATPDRPVADAVKYAMLHDISCRTNVFENNHRSVLECAVIKPTPQCRHAFISIDIVDEPSSSVLSMWSVDRRIKGKQSTWACLNAIGNFKR